MDIGLVLGGGGARGFAHIGVLQALSEHDLHPVAISACSFGGIVGAFYCADYTFDQMKEIAKQLSMRELLALGEPGGILGGKKIQEFLEVYLPATFEELSLPLTLTTVDVQEGHLVVLAEGALAPAIRASCSLPGILSPVNHEGRLLVDGGVLNSLPVDIIRTMTHEPVVAVDIAAPRNRKVEFNTPSLLDQMSRLLSGQKNPLSEIFRRGRVIDMFVKAYDIPQKALTDLRLSLYPPDLLIRPVLRRELGAENFDRAGEAIEAGYRTACEAIQGWLATLPEERLVK